MWILPKQLHTSPFVPDTAALISDSDEFSQLCAQSLTQRGKDSAARTWSAKLKRDSWMQHLYGRTLKPSHGQTFVTAWTSSLAATRASRSAQPANASAPKTRDTCGLTYQPELRSCDQVSVSLKTSRDISALGYPTCCKTWQDWVTERRGAWRQRVNAARHTRGRESASWPTANARDWKDSITGTHPPSRPNMSEQTLGQAVSVVHGQAAPASSNTHGSRQGLSWATPATRDTQGQREAAANARKGNPLDTLPNQMAQWGTTTARDHKSGRGNEEREYKELTPMVERQQSGKLNPRWVETLMGLPIGWTMPSCTSPVTIELMSCGALGTELFRLLRSVRGDFLLAS